MKPSRRHFLGTAASAGAVLGLGEWAGLLPLSPATADEARVTPDLVRFSPDIEPLVRLIEETPRAKCPAMMIGQLKKGLPYRNFLAAMFLAKIREGEVEHESAALHAANQLSLDAPVQERLLPAFWALDSFKFHQERGGEGRGIGAKGLMPLTGKLPPADQAEKEFHTAMKAAESERAQRAIVALVQTQGAARVLEPIWRYGARDWSFIGHNAIWVASTVRVLETVGWQRAEPMLRVLVASIQAHEPTMLKQGQPYAANVERVEKEAGKLPADWAADEANPCLTKDLLDLIRGLKAEEAAKLTLAQLVAGKVKAGAVWDAVHLAAGEMMMCTRNNSALHANTASNALHYAFGASGDPSNRLLILLQAVSWMGGMFRRNVPVRSRTSVLEGKETILDLPPADVPDRPEAAAEEILALCLARPREAAVRSFAFAKKWPDSGVLRLAAGRLLPLKANWDPHKIKFPVAIFEDCGQVSPEWRPAMAAAASCSFMGPDRPDSPVVYQVREALRKL
jgi:hypothetical protein